MALASTAFTPIVTRNEPPFGFHEVITPTDFKRCNENPYIGTEKLKEELSARFAALEKKRAKQRCRSEQLQLQLHENYEGYFSKGDKRRQQMSIALKWLFWIVVAAFVCRSIMK